MRRRVRDVMTREILTIDEEASFKEIVAVMADCRVSALPVLDQDGRVVGIVSEADLLLKEEFPEGPAGGRLFQSTSREVMTMRQAVHDHHPAPPASPPTFPGKYLSLTSFRRDGTGVATPVWFVEDGGRLLVETTPAPTRCAASAATRG